MANKKYRDFPIQVSSLNPENHEYRVRVSGQLPGGLPSYDEEEILTYRPESLIDNQNGREVNLLDALAKRRISEEQIYKLGSRLSDLLLPGVIRGRLEDSLRTVREREKGLRLRLIIEAPELAVMPWEYLYLNPAPGNQDSEVYFLGLRDDVSIVRHAAIDLRAVL